MAERGVVVDHSTLHHWTIRMVPLLDRAFHRHKRTPGRRGQMDETCIRVRWKYLCRAVDTEDQTIDFLLRAKRDATGAQRFFRNAIRHYGYPEVGQLAFEAGIFSSQFVLTLRRCQLLLLFTAPGVKL